MFNQFNNIYTKVNHVDLMMFVIVVVAANVNIYIDGDGDFGTFVHT